MFKLYDYSCTNEECDNYQKIMERLVDIKKDKGGNDQSLEDERCNFCSHSMSVILGYALGTVKQGTPKFHKNSKNK